MANKPCDTCEKYLPLEYFYEDPRTPGKALGRKCKACYDIKQTATLKDRLEYKIANPTKWHPECPDRLEASHAVNCTVIPYKFKKKSNKKPESPNHGFGDI